MILEVILILTLIVSQHTALLCLISLRGFLLIAIRLRPLLASTILLESTRQSIVLLALLLLPFMVLSSKDMLQPSLIQRFILFIFIVVTIFYAPTFLVFYLLFKLATIPRLLIILFAL